MKKWKRAAAATALLCVVQAVTGNGLVTLSAASPAETAAPAAQQLQRADLASTPLTTLIQDINADPFGLNGHRDNSPFLSATAVKSQAVRAQTTPQVGGGGGIPVAAKAAIWAAAIAVGSVWAWKTFSVTRGTD